MHTRKERSTISSGYFLFSCRLKITLVSRIARFPNAYNPQDSQNQTRRKGRKRAAIEEVATGGVKRSLVSHSNSEWNTVGKIKKVRLVNFMCHDNLLFTFGSKVNMLSGKNGSGKSAILTALVVGLGGRASVANRGNLVKNLIKNDEPRASIEITISNIGLFSYCPELYGDEITIIRNITQSASTYRFLSDKGKVISSKKKDLDKILMRTHVQINNPVCVLNQDTARSFLKSASPSEMYRLFMQGTLLSEVDEQIKDLRDNVLVKLREAIERRQLALDTSEADLIHYTDLIKKYKQLESAKKNKQLAENELLWSQIEMMENDIKESENLEVVAREEVEVLKRKTVQREQSEKNLIDTKRTLEEQLQEAQQELDGKEMQYLTREEAVSKSTENMNKITHEISKLEKKLRLERQRSNEITEEINNIEKNSAEREKERKRIVEQKEQLEKRVSEISAVLKISEHKSAQMANSLENAKSEIQKLRQSADSYVRAIAQKKERYSYLETSQDELSVYAEWMPRFVRAIDAAYAQKMFDERPLGPIGKFVRVKDQRWGPVIEKIFSKAILQSFIVTSSRDFNSLKKILAQQGIRETPQISISKFAHKAHNISSAEVKHSRYKSVMQTISVSDPNVFNVIVDCLQADTILLVPTDEETFPLVENIENVPKNCNRVYTMSGNIFFPQPNYKTYAGSVGRETMFLQASTDQVLRTLKEEIKKFENELAVCQRKIKDKKEEEETFKKSVHDASLEVDGLRRNLIVSENKLMQLSQKEIPSNLDVGILLEDLNFRNNAIQVNEKRIEDLKNEFKAAELSLSNSREELSVLEQQKSEDRNKLKIIRKKLAKVEEEIRTFSTSYNADVESLRIEMSRVERITAKLEKRKADLSKVLKSADEKCPERVESTRSKEELEGIVSTLDAKVKAIQNSIGDEPPPEPAEYEERKNRYEINTDAVVKCRNAVQSKEKCLQELTQTRSKLEKKMCGLTLKSFKTILMTRQFLGNMVFDHSKKTLELDVQPNPTINGKTGVSSLSGGERSFAMVAFIMALWTNMTCPFYFLDEFDVFMDEVNRKIIMKHLIDFAKSQPDKQFVFLTPHSLSDTSTDDVQFFRLEDPRK